MQFNQPDTLIPDLYNSLDWNRYSYARGNPVKYNDPSGHMVSCGLDSGNGCAGTGLGGLTPAQILNSEGTDEQKIRAIYNYSVTHPDYNYQEDPELEDIEQFDVANAIFLGNADYIARKSNLWDRISASWETLAHGIGFTFAAIVAGGGSDGNGHDTPISGPTWTKKMLSESEVIAQGSNIREVKGLVQKYGGDIKGWKKMKGWDEYGQEWHWYYHPNVGKVKVKPKW